MININENGETYSLSMPEGDNSKNESFDVETPMREPIEESFTSRQLEPEEENFYRKEGFYDYKPFDKKEAANLTADVDAEIAQLDLSKRIELLKYMSGMKDIDINEIQKEAQAELLAKILLVKSMGYLPSELNPSSWHLPENK